jgi:hypothetical protein
MTESYSLGNFTVYPTTPTSEIKNYCDNKTGQLAFANSRSDCYYFFHGLFKKWNDHRDIKLPQEAELDAISDRKKNNSGDDRDRNANPLIITTRPSSELLQYNAAGVLNSGNVGVNKTTSSSSGFTTPADHQPTGSQNNNNNSGKGNIWKKLWPLYVLLGVILLFLLIRQLLRHFSSKNEEQKEKKQEKEKTSETAAKKDTESNPPTPRVVKKTITTTTSYLTDNEGNRIVNPPPSYSSSSLSLPKEQEQGPEQQQAKFLSTSGEFERASLRERVQS